MRRRARAPDPVRGSAGAAVRGYFRRYALRYLGGALTLLAATGCAIAIPWTVKHAVDALGRDGASAPLLAAALTILALGAGNWGARMASRFAILGGAQRIEYDLRNALYASLQAYPPAFYVAHRTGDLMTRATSDISAVKSLVGFGALSAMGTAFAFTGALAAMIAVDPWLTLWAMAPYPLLIVFAKRVNTVVHEQTEAAQEELSALSATVQEHLAGMSVVRAYTMEEKARAAFAAANTSYLRASLRLARTQAQFWPIMTLIAGVGTLVVLWVGGKAVAEGRLSLGALVAFNGYLAYLAWPTMALGWTLSIVRRGLTSMQRILEITAPAPETGGENGDERAEAPERRSEAPEKRSEAPEKRSEAPELRFERLTFAYEGRTVLRDVSFTVAPGETVAVVGATGSGKSTLGVLLARLYEPPPGTIFLGGEDVTRLPLHGLRAQIGSVPQEAFLFSRSLLDNVTLGREGVGPAEARAAAGTAGIADDVAAWAERWDTVVGERGLTLSGGQRQRVALARALAAAPLLLVLDDVFASVDAAKEEEILANLREAASGRTVLLTTHRLRAAQMADRIVVLVEGAVGERGTHEELLAAGGVYARLWRIQQLEDEIARA